MQVIQYLPSHTEQYSASVGNDGSHSGMLNKMCLLPSCGNDDGVFIYYICFINCSFKAWPSQEYLIKILCVRLIYS